VLDGGQSHVSGSRALGRGAREKRGRRKKEERRKKGRKGEINWKVKKRKNGRIFFLFSFFRLLANQVVQEFRLPAALSWFLLLHIQASTREKEGKFISH
jgi:hypothetical protein